MSREKMKCGSCGCSEHKVYLTDKDDIILKCVDCSNESMVYVQPSKMVIVNHKGDGRITVFPK